MKDVDCQGSLSDSGIFDQAIFNLKLNASY